MSFARTLPEAAPVPIRAGVAWMQDLRDQAGPVRVIELGVANGRGIAERAGPIMRVVRGAAATDQDVAEQWTTSMQQTRTATVLADVLLP